MTRELTKMPKGKGITQRWRKKFRGEIYYFSGTYAQALVQWREKKDELDEIPQEEQSVKSKYRQTLDRLAAEADLAHSAGNLAVEAANTDKTINALTKNFIAAKLVEVEAGELSVGRWGALKSGLTQFVRFVGGEKPVNAITEETLANYKVWLLQSVSWKALKSTAAATYMGSTKQFVRWLWVMRLIDMPRNISRDKTTQIKVGQRIIKTFDVPEIKMMMDKAPERTKLYILLALNCGYYQSDLSDLTQEEVNLKEGTITRKRSKTEDNEETPVVTYYLWAETLRLLTKFNSQTNPFLKNDDGNPLVTMSVVNGQTHRTDCIHPAWTRLQVSLSTLEKPYKLKAYMLLRKTGATLLETHSEYGRYAQYYLGHAPRTMTEKRYSKPSEQQFKSACMWLGEQFGY